MKSFSERIGFVKPPEFMQLNGMTEELSNLLVNYCSRLLENVDFSTLSNIEDHINDLLKLKRRTFEVYGRHGRGFSFHGTRFSNSFERLAFHEKYSVLEAVVVFCGIAPTIAESNQILERENSGFRLNEECQLVPISNQEELDEVSEAQHSKIDLVALHMNKSVACFADREKPDYDNSIKESVSALEALAQKLSGEKGTLGALIKKLELHPSLKESVSKLYGYASDGGIRHAKKDGDPEVGFDTAKFVIVTSSALINFISAKSAND